jgi:dihydrofolate reductase
MIKIIAAVSENMVIGKDNKIPWHFPEDLKHFRESTEHHTVIMGRCTFESIGKILPKRRNIVISKQIIPGVESFYDLPNALYQCQSRNQFEDIWLIGGKGIYEEGMKYAEQIHLTRIPIFVQDPGTVKFPQIDSRFRKIKTIKIGALNKDIYIGY